MNVMSFDSFVESLDSVPPELERNFTLLTDLDKRTDELIKKINDRTSEYKRTNSKSRRLELRKETDELFERLNSFADDKYQLAIIAYDLIDKNIKRLENLGVAHNGSESATDGQRIAVDMPLDPNEPTYCICKKVSHGDMVACDNPECLIEWFHYQCVNLQVAPKGKWFCPNCQYFSKSKPARRPRRSRRY